MPPVAFLELLNGPSNSLQKAAEAFNDDRMKNVALSDDEALKSLQIWGNATACITASGAAELSPTAALQLSRKLVYDLPNVARHRDIWPKAVPLLCESMRVCVALLRWNPTSSDCQDIVAIFMESMEGQIAGSSKFKEFLFSSSMIDVLLATASEAVTKGSDNKGSNFTESASCLWFCARLLLMFVTKCPKNQHALASHHMLESLLRDVLPGAMTVEQQLLFMEILVRVLRKKDLPSNLTMHLVSILDGFRNTAPPDVSFHDHLTNLVLTLNKHNARHNATIHAVQPHKHAHLRRAELINSAMEVDVPEGAMIMYGGDKVALSLTFDLDTGVERDLCTLFKSDLKDVHYKAAGASDSATVTLRLGSVRTAIGTNICLQQAAQSLPKNGFLTIELELSKQDAKLLTADLKLSPKGAQQNVKSDKQAQAELKAQCEAKAGTTEDSQARNQNPRSKFSTAKGVVYRAKLDLKPVHPKITTVTRDDAETLQGQKSNEGATGVQNLEINQQVMEKMQGNKATTREFTTAASESCSPSPHVPPKTWRGASVQPCPRRASARCTEDSEPRVQELSLALSPSPDLPHITAEQASPSPHPGAQQVLKAQDVETDAGPMAAKLKAEPVKMKRRAKLNDTNKATDVSNPLKKKDIDQSLRNKSPRKLTELKHAANMKKSKAATNSHQPAPRARRTSSDPIEACFDAPRVSQKKKQKQKEPDNMKSAEAENMLVPTKSCQGKLCTTALNATATTGRPDRRVLKRNAKANKKYNDCDTSSNDDDPFLPPVLKPSCKRADLAVNANVAPQNQSGAKRKNAKALNTDSKSRVQTSSQEVPAAKIDTRKNSWAQKDEESADRADKHPPEEAVNKSGAHVSPQNASLVSLSHSLKLIPDTIETAMHAIAQGKEQEKEAIPFTRLNVRCKGAPRPVAGKVVPSPLSDQAPSTLNQLEFSNLGVADQQTWHQNQAILSKQGFPDGNIRSVDLPPNMNMSRYSPLMAGSLGMQFCMNNFAHNMPGPKLGQMDAPGFSCQHAFGAAQGLMSSTFPTSGFTSQIEKNDAVQRMSTLAAKNPPTNLAPYRSAHSRAEGGQEHDAALQLPGKLKRARGPQPGGTNIRQRKKNRADDDQDKQDALAEEQESKHLMQMISDMMQDEDAADDPGSMQQLQTSLSKLMKKKQQRSMNRDKRVLEDGQAKIDGTITEAQAQYLREEKELESSFQETLEQVESAMADKWKKMGVKHDEYLQTLQHEWMEYQLLGQSRTNLCAHQHKQVEMFRDKWQQTLANLEEEVGKEIVSLEQSIQKKKKADSRKKGLQAAQKMLQAMF